MGRRPRQQAARGRLGRHHGGRVHLPRRGPAAALPAHDLRRHAQVCRLGRRPRAQRVVHHALRRPAHRRHRGRPVPAPRDDHARGHAQQLRASRVRCEVHRRAQRGARPARPADVSWTRLAETRRGQQHDQAVEPGGWASATRSRRSTSFAVRGPTATIVAVRTADTLELSQNLYWGEHRTATATATRSARTSCPRCARRSGGSRATS